MSNIDRYLKMLKSDNPNKRYDACEELRVAPSIPKSALIALRKATRDSNPDVADAARRAVALHTSTSSSSSSITSHSPLTPISFWENPKSKLITVVLLFSFALLMTVKSPLYVLYLLWFPFGLVFWLNGWNTISGHSDAALYSVLWLGWLLYLGISITIVGSTNKKLIRFLLMVLISLLLVNVVGCQIQDSNYW